MQILREESEVIKSSDSMETSQASIELTPEMFRLLSSGMYTYKARAVMRELSCNGLDGQEINGNIDKPLKIHVPNALEPYFEVRDFGCGMSHQNIMDLYLSYGSSTKRNSNDQIGGFGIGSKSPFAIADSFTVTSYQQGTVRKYTVYMENGKPQITLLITAPTTEPDGMAVRVAVSREWFNEFVDEMQNVYSYFPVLPDFNTDFKSKFADYPVVSKKTGEYAAYGFRAGSSRSMYGSKPTIDIVMGPVGYNVAYDEIAPDVAVANSVLQSISHIAIYMPIGSVNVAASRETIQLDEKSRKHCQEVLKTVMEEMLVSIQADFDTCQKPIEVMKMLEEKFSSGGSNVTDYFKRRITFKCKTIKEHQDDVLRIGVNALMEKDGITPRLDANGNQLYGTTLRDMPMTVRRERSGRGKQKIVHTVNIQRPAQLSPWYSGDVCKYYCIIINDRRTKNQTIKTMGHSDIVVGILKEKECAEGILFEDMADAQAFINLHSLQEMPVYKTSDFEHYYEPKKAVRGNVKTFVNEYDDFLQQSDAKEVTVNMDDFEEPQLYLKSSAWEPEGSRWKGGVDVRYIAYIASKLLKKDVYIFRKTNWGKIPEDWIEVTPDMMTGAIDGVDWIEYQRYVLNSQCKTKELKHTIIHGMFNNSIIKGGYFYSCDRLKAMNLWDNFEALTDVLGRPAYIFASQVYDKQTHQGYIVKLLEVLSKREPFHEKVSRANSRIKRNVQRVMSVATKKNPLLKFIAWDRHSLKEILEQLGHTAAELTPEDIKQFQY